MRMTDSVRLVDQRWAGWVFKLRASCFARAHRVGRVGRDAGRHKRHGGDDLLVDLQALVDVCLDV